MSFTNFSGGLVNTIVAGLGDNISAGLTNQLTSNIQFSVGNVLAGAVESASGYFLDDGSNYLLNQVNGLVPPSVGNGLANAVVTQIASVGINAVRGFASQTVENLLDGRGLFNNGLTGSVLSGGTGFLGLHADGLPNADYGGSSYNISGANDVVFSVVPANPGPQSQPQGQTAPKWSLGEVANASFSPDNGALNSFKADLTKVGPGGGVNIGGRNFGQSYKLGKVATDTGITSSFKSLPVNW